MDKFVIQILLISTDSVTNKTRHTTDRYGKPTGNSVAHPFGIHLANPVSLFLVSLCQGWGAARNFFTASSDSLFHPPLSLVFFFQSSSSPALLTSLLTQSSHLSLGLPHLLLPCSHNSAALFGSLSSAILSTCPAHCNLLLTSLSVKLLCTPVSSLNSTILRLSALVTLAIFRTQLFSESSKRWKILHNLLFSNKSCPSSKGDKTTPDLELQHSMCRYKRRLVQPLMQLGRSTTGQCDCLVVTCGITF